MRIAADTLQDVLEKGIKVSERLVNNIRYADDKVLISSSQEGLEALVDAIFKQGEEYGFKINTEKTKSMILSRNLNKCKL